MDFLIDQDIAVAFSLQEGGAKKKLTKRNAVKRISPSAEGDQGSAFGIRKPLKRLDPNCIMGAVRTQIPMA
jgi:hypothetical protein